MRELRLRTNDLSIGAADRCNSPIGPHAAQPDTHDGESASGGDLVEPGRA